MTDQQQRPSDEVTAGVVGKWEPDRIVTTEHEGKLVEQVLGEGTAIRLAYVREPTTYTTEIEGDPRDDTGARSIAELEAEVKNLKDERSDSLGKWGQIQSLTDENERLREGLGKLISDVSRGPVEHCPWAIYTPQISVESINKHKALLKEATDGK